MTLGLSSLSTLSLFRPSLGVLGGGTITPEFDLDVDQGYIEFSNAGDTINLTVDAPPEYAGTYTDIDITPLALGTPVNWFPPAFDAAPEIGTAVSIINSQWIHPATGLVSITHQIQSNTGVGDAWEDISGETGPTFTATSGLVGKQVRVSATGGGVTVFGDAVAVTGSAITVIPGSSFELGIGGTTHTESAVSIGAEDATRRVYVAWAGQSGTTLDATVGGVSTVSHGQGAWGQHRMEIFSALVPTGTTADVVVTKPSGTFNGDNFLVFTSTGASVASGAVHSLGNIETTGPLTIDVTAVDGGTIVMTAMSNVAAWTFGGVTEFQQDDGLSQLVAAASVSGTPAGTTTVTAAATAVGTQRAAAVAIVLEAA